MNDDIQYDLSVISYRTLRGEVFKMGERKVMDCGKYPSDNNCTLRISGKVEEVMPVAIHHAITSHGHKDTPEFRKQLKSMLEDE